MDFPCHRRIAPMFHARLHQPNGRMAAWSFDPFFQAARNGSYLREVVRSMMSDARASPEVWT